MDKRRLRRELEPSEIPEDANESLPLAVPVFRPPPDYERLARGTAHAPGVELSEEPPEPGDPPRDPPWEGKPREER
jgi:hypothetical protein